MSTQKITEQKEGKTSTNCVTPPKLLSTINAVILSFISPVFSSFMGVFANTVKISASPPLLRERRQRTSLLLIIHYDGVFNLFQAKDPFIDRKAEKEPPVTYC